MADNSIKKNTVDLNRLELLVTIVRRKKADFYKDLIQSFDVNMQLTVLAHGTASTEVQEYLGLDDMNKIAILSVIRKENAGKALMAIEERFENIKNGKGIAFTIPMTSIIGVTLFGFLSNNRDMVREEKK